MRTHLRELIPKCNTIGNVPNGEPEKQAPFENCKMIVEHMTKNYVIPASQHQSLNKCLSIFAPTRAVNRLLMQSCVSSNSKENSCFVFSSFVFRTPDDFKNFKTVLFTILCSHIYNLIANRFEIFKTREEAGKPSCCFLGNAVAL